MRSTGNPKQRYLEEVCPKSCPQFKSAETDVRFRVMVIEGFLNHISRVSRCTDKVSQIMSTSFIPQYAEQTSEPRGLKAEKAKNNDLPYYLRPRHVFGQLAVSPAPSETVIRHFREIQNFNDLANIVHTCENNICCNQSRIDDSTQIVIETLLIYR